MGKREERKTVLMIGALLIVIFSLVITVSARVAEDPAPEENVYAIQPPREEKAQDAITTEVQEPERTPVPNTKETRIELEENGKPENLTKEETPSVPEPDSKELEMLACVIYQEAGSNYISDETRFMVGDVVLTRIADSRFPDTMEDVLTQPGQYGEFYWTGIKWSERAKYEPEAVKRAYETAFDLLTDAHHSDLYGKGYIWQAEFPQGVDVIYVDGMYFGK